MESILPNVVTTVINLTDKPYKKGVWVALIVWGVYKFKQKMNRIDTHVSAEATFMRKEIKGYVDTEFFRKLNKLLKIAIPRVLGRESMSVVALSILLVVRSLLSIYISDVNGSIVKAIVNRSLFNFIKQVKYS